MIPIAHIENAYDTKFGVPRQSGLVETVESLVVFEPEYRDPHALRGIESFSHLWLIWEFLEAKREKWSPTVRPPRLGGNTRIGVFATRSPFRPNPLGLSCVRLTGLREEPGRGTVLVVAGADLMHGTPIYDVKPYLPYADCHPDAAGGFTDTVQRQLLTVQLCPELELKIPQHLRQALRDVLAQDPRPSYQKDPKRIYGMRFGGLEVRFRVHDRTLEVLEVEEDR